jgi:Fe-S-cluster-containing dehydrogenase component
MRPQQVSPLDEFVRQGLMNARSLLVLDLTKCTRCDECTKACHDAHMDDITRLIREGLRYENWLVASACRACLDPYCMAACPVDSIHRQPRTGQMVIEDHCIGCGQCATNCPYGNINMHGVPGEVADPSVPGGKKAVVQQRASMCDLCIGEKSYRYNEPSCVYACPHDAAHRYSGDEFRAVLEKSRGRRR